MANADSFTIGDLNYTEIYGTDRTVSVKAANTKISGDLVIPSTIKYGTKEYTVTTIGQSAFESCNNLTSVDIPNTVTGYIGMYAFCNCTNLTTITIPNSINEIAGLTFGNCINLKSITLPESIKSISGSAFANCRSLTTINIPKSVTRIGMGPFSGCTNLEVINVDIDNENYASFDGALYNKSLTEMIQCPGAKTSITFPSTLTTLWNEAMTGCIGFTSVNVPNSVTEIGISTFTGCTNLTSITISKSITKFWPSSFQGCNNLTSTILQSIIPPTYSELGNNQDNWFYYSNIKLYVPNSALDTYKTAEGWSKAKQQLIGYSTTETISQDGLQYIIDLCEHTGVVTYAEQNSLQNYDGMLSVDVQETVEYDGEAYTVTAIGDEAFNNCWGLKAVSLPSTLQTVGQLAFGYCTSLRSVSIPEEVTKIDNEAFTGCSALASVEIGSSVETIGDYAFFGCTGLSELKVPASVKTIGENAFMGIHWIKEVHAQASEPIDAPTSAFSANAYKNATLVVPDGAVDSYKAHPTWSNFLEIRQASDSPTRIEVIDGALEVKGSNNVRVYDMKGGQVYSGSAGHIELSTGIYLVVTDTMSKKVKI